MSETVTYHESGSRIGDYIIDSEIGRGGMGVVYRARKADTGEIVALKLMLPELAANPEYRERFVREAEFGPNLDHPNIVPIFHSGEATGHLYIAMRLVDGCDLKEMIKKKGRVEPSRVLSIFRQVTAALDAAHEAGVVHRDVKPQNILITRDDQDRGDLVYITDFGLVKPVGSESNTSRTGQILGSIQYMPPELVEGLAADGRADVYSLGCVLYECLTGKIPFDRPNEVAVLWAHIHEAPPRVTDEVPELPGGLDSVVGTALAKHPDDRFLTCGELMVELEKGLSRKQRPVVMPIVRPLVKRASRRKTEREVWAPNFFPELSRVRKLTDRTNWVQVTGVISVLCLLAAALVQFAHPRGILGAMSDAAVAIEDSVSSSGEKITAAFSQDETAAQGAPGGGLVAKSARRAADGDGARGEDTSNDDESINAPVPDELAGERDASGDRVQSGLPPLSGKIMFESTRSNPGMCCDYGIYVMNADGSDLQTVYNDPMGDELDAAWSPDGSQIAFGHAADLYVMDADGSDRREVYSGGWAQDPAWSPDGTRIAFSRHDRTDAGPMDEGWDVWVVDVDGTGARPLTGLNGFDRFPTWSGDRVAFAANRESNIDIYISDPNGRNLRRSTNAASTELMPEFSPDGNKLAYVVNRNGGFDVYSKSVRLRAPETRVTRTLEAFAPDWSPDGNWIAFSGGRSEGFSIWGENDIFLVPASGDAKPVRWTIDPPSAGYTGVSWDFNPSWI